MNMDNNEQKNKKNLIRIFFEGSIYSKLSFIICGLANIVYGQVVKGLLFLLVEVAYILFMVQSGITNLVNLHSPIPNPQIILLETIKNINYF